MFPVDEICTGLLKSKLYAICKLAACPGTIPTHSVAISGQNGFLDPCMYYDLLGMLQHKGAYYAKIRLHVLSLEIGLREFFRSANHQEYTYIGNSSLKEHKQLSPGL